MRATILLSGGIDSMACTHFYLSKGYIVDAIFFDYGQKAYKAENYSAKSISDYFNILLHTIKIPSLYLQNNGYYVGRNALFVLHALSQSFCKTEKIILGIHDGTPYGDCSKRFLDALQVVIDLYANGTIVCEAPFLSWHKSDIISYAQENKLPIDLTYSCESGSIPPCGRCPSCLDRKGIDNE